MWTSGSDAQAGKVKCVNHRQPVVHLRRLNTSSSNTTWPTWTGKITTQSRHRDVTSWDEKGRETMDRLTNSIHNNEMSLNHQMAKTLASFGGWRYLLWFLNPTERYCTWNCGRKLLQPAAQPGSLYWGCVTACLWRRGESKQACKIISHRIYAGK